MVIDLQDKNVHNTTRNVLVIHLNHDETTNDRYRVCFVYVTEIFK